MREILFRGKNLDDEWIEGNLVHQTKFYGDPVNRYHIVHVGEFDCDYYWSEFVIPETIGQYTGLADKNGKRIFEGDVIKADNGNGPPAIAVVKFGENYPTMFYTMMDVLYPGYKRLPAISFYAESIGNHQHLILFQSPCVEVIGNIHDNPELLGERKEHGS